MATMKQLTRAAVALGGAVLLRKLFQRAAHDPEVREKAGALGRQLRDRALSAGKATGETMDRWIRAVGRPAGPEASEPESTGVSREPERLSPTGTPSSLADQGP
jgi:hypothetical protein